MDKSEFEKQLDDTSKQFDHLHDFIKDTEKKMADRHSDFWKFVDMVQKDRQEKESKLKKMFDEMDQKLAELKRNAESQ